MPIQLRLIRLWVRLTSLLAPRYAERFSARLFLTPRKRPATPLSIEGVTPEQFSLALNGEELVGWRWGRSESKVLLLHGWSGRAADMSHIAGALAARGYEAVAIDMPAHGSSAGKTTNLAIWSQLIPVIGRKLGPFTAVIGHSFGAAAVTLALDAGLDVQRAILIAPPLGPLHFITGLREFIGLPLARAAGMEAELVRIVGRPISDFNADVVASRLLQPALIFHDPEDDEVPFAHGASIAAGWRGSSLVPVVGEGHFRILKSREVINRLVDFVDESLVRAENAHLTVTT